MTLWLRCLSANLVWHAASQAGSELAAGAEHCWGWAPLRTIQTSLGGCLRMPILDRTNIWWKLKYE